MAEHIKREAAIAYIREQCEEKEKAFEELGGESGIYADAYNDLAEDFYRIPAADVAPVVHGRWDIHIDPTTDMLAYCKCSNCGHVAWDDSDYCPNCGARMDGEGGDGDETPDV